MLRIDVGLYTLAWAMGHETYVVRRRDATAREEIGLLATAEQVGALAVYQDPFSGPVLLVVAGCTPWYDGHQLDVGALLVPETHTLFVGALDSATRGLWRSSRAVDTATHTAGRIVSPSGLPPGTDGLFRGTQQMEDTSSHARQDNRT